VTADYSYDREGRLTNLVYHQGSTVLAGYAYTYSGSSQDSPLLSGEGQGVRAAEFRGHTTNY
jgi:hypothetical protein